MGELSGGSHDRRDLIGEPSSRDRQAADSTEFGAGRRGADVEAEVTLRFSDSIDGITMRLALDQQCEPCSGTGTAEWVCPTCSGAGRLLNPRFGNVELCRDCEGHGVVLGDLCSVCRGSGRVMGSRTISARVPAGIRDGQRIRLKGKGASGERGGPAGDLYVLVHVEPHPVFGREDDNLTVTVPVTFPEAMLGAKIPVPTLGGMPVTAKLPPYSQNGRELRVRGRGVARENGPKGDLLVRFEIAVPERISSAAKEALDTYMRLTSHHDPRLESDPPEFVPVGDDLGVTVPVTFPEAVFGAEIPVPTPNGAPVTVRLQPATVNGQKLRVRKHGGHRGSLRKDLRVTVEVVIPEEVSDEAADAVRAYGRATAMHAPRAWLLHDAAT